MDINNNPIAYNSPYRPLHPSTSFFDIFIMQTILGVKTKQEHKKIWFYSFYKNFYVRSHDLNGIVNKRILKET
jgi:hypothetical protein